MGQKSGESRFAHAMMLSLSPLTLRVWTPPSRVFKQICIPAFGFSCMALYLNKRDWAIVTQQGFFHGYTMSSWLLCANACVGGLLVSYL